MTEEHFNRIGGDTPPGHPGSVAALLRCARTVPALR